MAFCPECGKAVTPDEAACSSCGNQIRSEAKKARNGRFHGTMMMTAPEVKQEPPANLNGQRPNEQAEVVAAAAGMTSPRLGIPAAAKRSSLPPSAKQGGNLSPSTGTAQKAPSHLKATMIGAGAAPKTAPQKPANKHATMLGAALAPTTPRSKPPGSARAHAPSSVAPEAKSSVAPPAKPSTPPAQAQEIAKSERPPVVRQTMLHASASPSVRAVQSMPVGPAIERSTPREPAAAPNATPVLHDAKTVPSPLPPRNSERALNPAHMVQAIPEVDGTVVDPNELPNNMRTAPHDYSSVAPVASQPPAAHRSLRLREHPFAPEVPEQEGQGNYILLYWAVCVAVVAAACALAFRLF